MNKKRTVLISLVTFLLLFIVNSTFAFQSEEPLDKARANNDFNRLSTFLEEKGYVMELDHVVSTTITEDPFKNERNGRLNVTVSLIPFLAEDGSSARVAHWEGYWNDKYYSGALATIGDTETYLVDRRKIRSTELEDFDRQFKIPLYAMSGPVPFGRPEFEVNELDTLAEDVPMEQSYRASAYMSSGCRSVNVARNGYTLLGNLAWKFHQTKYWCYNGSTVYNVSVGTYVSNMDPFFYYRGIVNTTDYFNNSNSTHYSMRQGHIENCVVKYGCYWSAYPGVKIWANSSGSFSWYTWQ